MEEEEQIEEKADRLYDIFAIVFRDPLAATKDLELKMLEFKGTKGQDPQLH